METFYLVLEVQATGTSPSVLTTSYTDIDQAYSKYYAILTVAAVSPLPYHAAHIIRSSDGEIEGKVYDRRQPAASEG